MKDFTLGKYRELLVALKRSGRSFLAFEDYCDARRNNTLPTNFAILRHDVDLKAANSLRTAQIEHELGIRASYYFRIVPQSNCPDIIRQIASLGHEIGYHYEDMSIMGGDVEMAIEHFGRQLAYFRQYYPVRTVCMHSALTSRFDGRDLWKKYNYRDFGIVGEPYFDTDFSSMLYLTDTGRCWDGYKVSVRDKIAMQDEWVRRGWVFHSTDDIISRLAQDTDNALRTVMFTTHPQRWTDNTAEWMKERIMQSIKNRIKRIMIWSKEY